MQIILSDREKHNTKYILLLIIVSIIIWGTLAFVGIHAKPFNAQYWVLVCLVSYASTCITKDILKGNLK